MPPVFGYSPASSARVSAPHNTKIPPPTQIAASGSGPGNLSAIPAGDRKIPDPIVDPTRTATALHIPRRRGRADDVVRFAGDIPNGSANPSRARVAYGAMNPLTREWMFWLAAAACALAEAAIIVSSIRTLSRANAAKAAREAM